jgi:exonuclease III
LIAGDFNAVAPRDRVVTESMPARLKAMLTLQGGRFFHRAIKTILSAGYTDCYRHLHPDEDGFTLPVPTPTIRLDYVFANEGLKASLQKCYVIKNPGATREASDHYPVMAEFAL